MTSKYIVATGIVDFEIEANSAFEAIETLKGRFTSAADDPHFMAKRWGFGISLVNAQKEGRLNYLVFDVRRREVLAGELAGHYQEPPSRELLDAMRYHLTDSLYWSQVEKLRTNESTSDSEDRNYSWP